MSRDQISQVVVVHTEDRQSGVVRSIRALGVNPVKNKDVLIKPNFNTADVVPGSTHNDTLVALVSEAGAGPWAASEAVKSELPDLDPPALTDVTGFVLARHAAEIEHTLRTLGSGGRVTRAPFDRIVLDEEL